MSSFQVSEVEKKVKQILSKDCNHVEDCRSVYLEEIMDWSDYYTESGLTIDTEEGHRFVINLIDLWYSFIKFEASLRYFKQASNLFEKALIDPIVGNTADIYHIYAEYFLSRGKSVGVCAKGYLKGLTNTSLSVIESQKLWLYFADFLKLHQHYSAENMQALRDKISEELPEQDRVNLAPAPSDDQVESIRKTLIERKAEDATTTTSTSRDVAESKESEDTAKSISNLSSPARLNVPSSLRPYESSSTTTLAPAVPVAGIPSLVPPAAKPSNPMLATVDIVDLESNPTGGLNAEQLIRMFRKRPPMLFVAPTKEPMKSGINGLIADEVLSLEKYLDTNLCYNNGANANGEKLEYVLDMLEAMWYSQGLKERHFDAWCIELRNIHFREKALLDKRLQVLNMPDLAIRMEKEKFENKCAVQRELLQAIINKVLYTILMEQERILVTLQFPRFSKPFLTRLESMQFSTATTATSLFDEMTTREILSQRKFVCSLLSLRLVSGRCRPAPSLSLPNPMPSSNPAVLGNSSSAILSGLQIKLEVPQDLKQHSETTETPGSSRKKRRRTISSTSPDSGMDMLYLKRADSYGDEGNVRVVNSTVNDADGNSEVVMQLVSSSYDQVVSNDEDVSGDEAMDTNVDEDTAAQFSDVEGDDNEA